MLNHFRATLHAQHGRPQDHPGRRDLLDLGSNWYPLPDGPQMPPDFEVVRIVR